MATQLVIGTDPTGKEVVFSAEARKRGTYVLGTQGTGKTTFLMRLALADIAAGEGVAFITPAGDVIRDLLARIPKNRVQDVILWTPAECERPFGFNVFECDPDNDNQVVQVALNVVTETFKRLWGESWGPQMEEVLRICALTIAWCQGLPEAERPTLSDFSRLLTQSMFRQRYIEHLRQHYPVLADDVLAWWDRFEGKKPYEQREQTQSTLNKASRFTETPFLKNIFGQATSSFNLRQIMDERKILLVNLDKGKLALDDVRILGSLLVARFYIAALSRGDLPEKRRKQFHLIVDEFQNFASYAFFELFEEARKYGVDVVIAHQNLTQLPDDMQSRALGAGNKIIFQVTGDDGSRLKVEFDVDKVGRRVVGEHIKRNLSNAPWPDLKKGSHELEEVRNLVVEIEQKLVEWDEKEWDYQARYEKRKEELNELKRKFANVPYGPKIDDEELNKNKEKRRLAELNFGGSKLHIYDNPYADTGYRTRPRLENLINRYLYDRMHHKPRSRHFYYDLEEVLREIFLGEHGLQFWGRGRYTPLYPWQRLSAYWEKIHIIYLDPKLHHRYQEETRYKIYDEWDGVTIYREILPPKILPTDDAFWSIGQELVYPNLPAICDPDELETESNQLLAAIEEASWETRFREHRQGWIDQYKDLRKELEKSGAFHWYEQYGEAWDDEEACEAFDGRNKDTLYEFNKRKRFYRQVKNYLEVGSALERMTKLQHYEAAQKAGLARWKSSTSNYIKANFEPLGHLVIELGDLLSETPIIAATGQSEPLLQSVADARDQIGNDLAAQLKYHAWVKLTVENSQEHGQFRDMLLANAAKPSKGWQKRTAEIKDCSCRDYGRDRNEVEQHIYNRRQAAPPLEKVPAQTDE